MSEPGDTIEALEQALASRSSEIYHLHLYVTGASPLSRRAIANLTQLCDRYLAGRYELEIIDLYQQPECAMREQVVVAPTLVKSFPLPERRLIGPLSDPDAFLRLVNAYST